MKTLIENNLPGFRGNAQLWKLSEPIAENNKAKYEYVIVSAAEVPFSGPETYIFGSDKLGQISSWSELAGSYRGGMDHRKAIEGAGYTIV